MNKRKLLSTRVALLSVLLLSSHTAALARKPVGKLPLPDVHLGLNKAGLESAILIPPAASKAASPALPSLSVPGVAIRMAPPIVSAPAPDAPGGVSVSVTVPPLAGLTLPLGANVNVNTGGSGLAVGVDVSGATLQLGGDGIPGTLPSQDVYAPGLMAIAQGGGQPAERSLEQVPTCR